MLIDFSIENYRSIADRQTISFVASKHRSNAEGQAAVAVKGLRSQQLLTSAVIYGANASGKSNVVRALAEACGRIRTSATEPEHDIQPFLLDPRWATKPSRFEFTFLLAGVRYQYGFALDASLVHEEWLIAYPHRAPQLWFERRWDGTKHEITFGSSLKGEKSRTHKMTRPDALFLSVAAQLNQESLIPIHQELTQRLRARQASWVAPADTAHLVEQATHHVHDAFLSLLAAADVGIRQVVVKRHKADIIRESSAISGSIGATRVLFRSHQKDELFEIQTEHERSDGERILFNLSDESQGTIQYFSLLAPLIDSLFNGGLLAVDELDESLHPLLVRKIVGLFHDPAVNVGGAQLLFNTHDTTLLDRELFRRDQIWFVEKEPPGKSRLYSLLDFSPRRDEALQKGYLQGRYGAIPFLGDFTLSDAHSAKESV
ncbi:hypothetical protein BE21_11440 [Sorangium cellulosum]|uniref:ATPase AAA-type core domain-containing protein n=1 Tax=Sorangium cellulosum TaxID=56 RepID=A0A150U138_SORCE|nr:hypothetical protein BE21_11440 [Sorangium cellulosum]